MIKRYFILIIINIINNCNAEEVHLIFFQKDYDVKMDISECPWYDKAYLKHFNASFVPYNRTQRVYNASIEPLIDMGSGMMIDVQLYKMMSNEYRFFPVTFRTSLCSVYRTDAFGFGTMFNKTSNINPCNVKKRSYYIRNAIPDFSKCPPHMPRGSYKLVAQFLFYSTPIAQVDYYARIVDKPIEWKKIPKSKGFVFVLYFRVVFANIPFRVYLHVLH